MAWTPKESKQTGTKENTTGYWLMPDNSICWGWCIDRYSEPPLEIDKDTYDYMKVMTPRNRRQTLQWVC